MQPIVRDFLACEAASECFLICEPRLITWHLEVTLAELVNDCCLGELERLPNDTETTLDHFADPFPDFGGHYRFVSPLRSLTAERFRQTLKRYEYRPATLREVLHLIKEDPQLPHRYPNILAYGSVSRGRIAKKIACITRREVGIRLVCCFADTEVNEGSDWVAVTENNRPTRRA